MKFSYGKPDIKEFRISVLGWRRINEECTITVLDVRHISLGQSGPLQHIMSKKTRYIGRHIH